MEKSTTIRYLSLGDVAASGLVMRKSRYPLADCNLYKEKDLNRLPVRCYALTWSLKGSLSQNALKLPENRPVARSPFPRWIHRGLIEGLTALSQRGG